MKTNKELNDNIISMWRDFGKSDKDIVDNLGVTVYKVRSVIRRYIEHMKDVRINSSSFCTVTSYSKSEDDYGLFSLPDHVILTDEPLDLGVNMRNKIINWERNLSKSSHELNKKRFSTYKKSRACPG